MFAEGGFLGLVIYAIVLGFFLLLLRDFLKDWMIRSISKEQTAANLAAAKALQDVALELRAVNVQLSQLQSALGFNEWRRAVEKGEAPLVLPEPRKDT